MGRASKWASWRRRSVQVTAREIELVRKENLQAAETPQDASEAMARLLKALPVDPPPTGTAAKNNEIIPKWPI